MKSTTDLWFSAYLISQGHEVSKFDVLNRGKGKYYFNLTDEQWKDYKLKFNNSESAKLKMIMDQLKDLTF